MKQILKSLPVLFLILIAFSCENDQDKTFSFDKLQGYIQKGPFNNGTSITIFELTGELAPTGKSFSSQILDNKGTFEINNIELVSQYVELKADGFYFNEVRNDNSEAQLTLYALSDLNVKSSLNVNVLSHLEKARVNYLIANGSDFSAAKKQAQGEILAIFGIGKDDIVESELLDITKPGDDNAILLAISVILQGYLPVSNLSELLANISTDIREDGVLNSQSAGTILLMNANAIKPDEIRRNLENRYQALGLDITVPDFEKYVNQFIANTEFEFEGLFNYPANGKHGLNLLDKTRREYPAGTHSMKAILREGASLKVKISGRNWFLQTGQVNTGWEYTDWNDSDSSRVFTSTRTGELDLAIALEHYQESSRSNASVIEVFENGASQPSWVKEVAATKTTVTEKRLPEK